MGRRLGDEAKRQQPPEPEEPENLKCTITFTMFRDPVVLASGNTYERQAITAHLLRRPTDPTTNESLKNYNMIPNWHVRREVQAFLDSHSEYIPHSLISQCTSQSRGSVKAPHAVPPLRLA